MSDGRDFLRNMWTQTATNDKDLERGMVDTTPLSRKTADQYPIGTGEVEHLFGRDVRHMPDQYKHKVVSFIKSGVRILGFGVCWWSLDIGLTLLILAEVIGVGEELV